MAPKLEKSASLSAGAGALGLMLALSDIVIGSPPTFFPPRPRPSLPPSPRPLFDSFPPFPLAICAAFLFRRSIDGLWPGNTCARAHWQSCQLCRRYMLRHTLCPNLHVPLTNHAHTSFSPRSPGPVVCENGHAAPAVHPPTRKNLHGT